MIPSAEEVRELARRFDAMHQGCIDALVRSEVADTTWGHVTSLLDVLSYTANRLAGELEADRRLNVPAAAGQTEVQS